MSDLPHALIAGAGIGGLTAALFLARAGFRVSLLERAELMEEVGAGLQISPNASRHLRELGVLPHLTDAALAPEALLIRRAQDGALLQQLPLDNAEARWGAPYLLVHRADLQRALLETVAPQTAITLSMQTEVSSFTSSRKGLEVKARQDGRETTFTADFAIGADGLRSIFRQQLGRDRPGNDAAAPGLPHQAKYLAWRTLVDAEDVAPALRRPLSTLWLGPKAHLVHYPLRGGTVINVVAVVDASITIDWARDLWSEAGATREIAARFSSWHEDVRALVGAAREWRKWPLVDLAPLPSWCSGRVALLGDAAHPMLPFLAQGAAQAIEDAAMLGRLLTPDGPIEPQLAAYSAARRPRANLIQRESRRQAAIYHASGAIALLRDFALQTMSPKQILGRYDWIYRR